MLLCVYFNFVKLFNLNFIQGWGDCDRDDQCVGGLVCGNNNCLNYRGTGGIGDSQDDCCEQRCTSSNLCTHGEGHCTADSVCERNGFHICSGSCIGTNFDTEDFPNNTDIKYDSGDTCCVRRCSIGVCSINQEGCLGPKECK